VCVINYVRFELMEYPECRNGNHLVKKRFLVWIFSLQDLPWLTFIIPHSLRVNPRLVHHSESLLHSSKSILIHNLWWSWNVSWGTAQGWVWPLHHKKCTDI